MKAQIKLEGNIVDTSKRKPDLIGTSGAQTDGAKRILAHLEHGARLPASKPARAASWTIDGWTLGLGLLLLTMCCIAWLMHEKSATSGAFKASYSSTHGSPRHERRDENSQASARLQSARTAPGEVIVEPAELPAAIVNEPGSLQVRTEATTASTTAPHVIGPAALATQRPRLAPVGATYPKSPSGSAISKYSSTASTTSAAIPRATAATAAAAATVAASRGKSAAPASDTDVTLLTALVAHADKPVVVAPERSRDIVERREGDSTADLLARCKQLGLIEGMLCRSRICSGRWESDATCRAPAL